DSGWWVWGYTAGFGSGVSATISAEVRRMTQIVDENGITAASSLSTSATGAGYGGWQGPAVGGNNRIRQAWGRAEIMAATHEDNALYYGPLTIDGHPGDELGWVAGAGLHFNTSAISQGDYLEGEVNYTEGALRYLNQTANTTMTFANGGAQSYGI